MPVEIRRLLFTDDEFRAAVDELLAGGRAKLPRGRVVQMEITTEDPLAAGLSIQTEHGQVERATLDDAHAAAAVIAYCRKRSIPLPRSGSKSLRRTSKGIAFDVTLKESDRQKASA